MDTASKNLDQTALAQITPAQLMRKHTSDLQWQDAHGTGHGTNTKRSHGPSFHESRTAFVHANQAKTSLMKKFKTWLCRVLLKYNNERTSAEFLLNE